MTAVYLLRKHTVGRSVWAWGRSVTYTVEGVYSDRATPQAIADDKNKNKRAMHTEWTVQRKEVK